MGLLLVGWPAYAQEQDFFALLDEDRRREFTLELGPSFMEDPVFRGFEDASGIIHPATKVNLKTPRHISGTFGWRLNDWLRVEASINFNAADFDGASSANSEEEDRLTGIFRDGSPNFETRSSRDLIEGIVGGVVVDGTRSGGIVLPLLRQRSNEVGFDGVYNPFITARQEYIDEFAPNDMDDPCDAACARMRAEMAIRTDEAGEMALEMARMQGDEAFSAFITARQEYIDALAPDDMDDPCDAACARMRAEMAIRTDEAGVMVLAEQMTLAVAAGNAQQMDDEDANETAAMSAGEIAGREVAFSSQTSYSAGGTFFGIGSFLSAYADIPLTSGIWLYGGGGAGISWSHVKEGFYSRSTILTINNDNDELDAIQQMIEEELGIDDLDEISTNTTLSNFEGQGGQRTDIISTITSFAMTGAVGFRTVVFEGLVIDSGYQVIWTQKGFYRGADEEIAHLVRVGFVFNF